MKRIGRAIILAAGMGRRLGSKIQSPKCLIEINGENLLERYVKILHYFGLYDITLVVGYEYLQILKSIEEIEIAGLMDSLKIIYNMSYKEGSILSLYEARDELQGDVLLMDGDLYFEPFLIERIIDSQKEDFFVIDRNAEYDEEAVLIGFENEKAIDLARGLKGQYSVLGEWAGCLKLSTQGTERLQELVTNKVAKGERELGYEFIIPELFETITISYELIDGIKWLEIDFLNDIERASTLGIASLEN